MFDFDVLSNCLIPILLLLLFAIRYTLIRLLILMAFNYKLQTDGNTLNIENLSLEKIIYYCFLRNNLYWRPEKSDGLLHINTFLKLRMDIQIFFNA